ncbi:Asp-tRNA(Asn)/Glu-tRNA(Gln) amidotransferase subunit GatA [Cerasicoccus arenae]|uniref:Glutamyl-tRNA(Gln) amidotransferase subunit A n=1 Tax=Cerasicoccus arenae TaxID=424488 RepID=A0A8J3DES0_9BACT|nr:Asp-tRNA(Asn)/Glu-tRNA(Gln) amidotransferase subunit GatA [Cerasicoccus arenae]MBK1857093.1 Asp-tRNA(Asn)/Glu-tRNA(Gln) amidotransferase subunit GatA [Cerasicoccus arenae]GHB92326.1 glutamyl-tRNA(Gln) amidotransferase subunit A [Cerasicoccus arenae]
MPELYESTAAELSTLLASGQTSAKEIMAAYLSRIEQVDGNVRAFNSYDHDDALRQADASDTRRREERAMGPLDGIPVALKDVIAVKDQPLTASSKMLKDFVSPYDSHVTELLKRQGAVLFGRLNLDEFAMGSSTENSGFQRTCNPWDLERIPGGSSGGSAAAIAACEAPLTLGSDTGGSIRQPAALCGVVGMKPTYGLVSRYGLIAFASSLDQIGPFAQTVEDAAILLQGIVGHDRRDSTSIKMAVPDYRAALKTDKKWRLGVPKEYFGEGLDAEVRAAVEAAIKTYEGLGHEIVEVSLPTTDLAVPVYYILAPAEASSNLSRYDGIRYGHRSSNAADAIDVYYKSRAEGFGPEVKRRIILGSYVLSSGYYDAYYLKAQKARTIIRNDFNSAFEQCDALLTPTAPTAAFKAGEKTNDPLSMYLSDIFTINVNLAGLPGVSVPCGFTSTGLPIGLQIIGKAFEEAEMLAIAHAYEQQHDWGKQRPSL